MKDIFFIIVRTCDLFTNIDKVTFHTHMNFLGSRNKVALIFLRLGYSYLISTFFTDHKKIIQMIKFLSCDWFNRQWMLIIFGILVSRLYQRLLPFKWATRYFLWRHNIFTRCTTQLMHVHAFKHLDFDHIVVFYAKWLLLLWKSRLTAIYPTYCSLMIEMNVWQPLTFY